MKPEEIGESASHRHIKGVDKNELKKKLARFSEKQKKDKIDLSSEAQRVSEYIKLVKQIPGIREEKVREVEQKLAAGEYESEEILEKTLKKMLEDTL